MNSLAIQFAALGDSTRLAIIERLLAKGELSAGDLQDVADVSAPAISRHLKVLRDAGLVNRRIDAQRRIYRVDPRAMEAIGEWTLNNRKFWDASLDRLAAALDEES